MSDLISIEFSPADIQKALTLIDELRQLLEAHLITLPKAQRRKLLRMGDANEQFAVKSLEYAGQLSKFHPPYFNYDEMKKDMTAYQQLRQLQQRLVPLQAALEDTIMAAGSDVLSASHVFYRVLKQAAQMNDPDANAALDDLKKRFELSERNSKPK